MAGDAEPGAGDTDLTERWQSLFAMRFQRPLYDPEPEPPPPVEEKVIPPPPIRILGTMPEPSGGHATIEDNNGNTYVLSVGATINAGSTKAKILKVTNDQVELEHEGRVITMKLDQS